MWNIFFGISVFSVAAAAIASVVIGSQRQKMTKKASIFKIMIAGVFLAVFCVFFPARNSVHPVLQSVFVSAFNALQVFALGCEFETLAENLQYCPEYLQKAFSVWSSALFLIAPAFTFGFVLSLFKNVSALCRYTLSYRKNAFIFSELNEESLALASDIKANHPDALIVFNDVFVDDEEQVYEWVERAAHLGAICFKKDILAVRYDRHSPDASITFFAIGNDETENLNQTLQLLKNYRNRNNTHIYVFTTGIESELLLSQADKGAVKVRRINEVRSLVNRLLYDNGEIIFETARPMPDGTKHIGAVVIGMGRYGTEMIKALAWFGQMDGYTLSIDAFDKDPAARDRLTALAPELLSPAYNGIRVAGEAQYTIRVHEDTDVNTASFYDKLKRCTNTSYVLVSLGSDKENIQAAAMLRMYFERMKIHPVIQTVIYNTPQKNALCGIRNFSGQSYDIDFIGDTQSFYTEDVIMNSALEKQALARHLKWGEEEEFWAYEYNYRSSCASAIHMKARIKVGIPGADKKEEDLTAEERDVIEQLEHRRWNAYMRAEGYIFSGSTEKSSRNNLGKMHHDLVDFSSLSEEEKRKDSQVGTA